MTCRPIPLQEWARQNGQAYRKVRAILSGVGSSPLPQARAVRLTLISGQLAVWPADSADLLAFIVATLSTGKANPADPARPPPRLSEPPLNTSTLMVPIGYVRCLSAPRYALSIDTDAVLDLVTGKVITPHHPPKQRPAFKLQIAGKWTRRSAARFIAIEREQIARHSACLPLRNLTNLQASHVHHDPNTIGADAVTLEPRATNLAREAYREPRMTPSRARAITAAFMDAFASEFIALRDAPIPQHLLTRHKKITEKSPRSRRTCEHIAASKALSTVSSNTDLHTSNKTVRRLISGAVSTPAILAAVNAEMAIHEISDSLSNPFLPSFIPSTDIFKSVFAKTQIY